MAPKIALVIEGTRGDSQPYIALTLGLMKAGFPVKYFTCCNMVSFVSSHGIDVVSCGPDVEKQLEEEEELQSAMKTGNFMKFCAALDCARCLSDYRNCVKAYWTAVDEYNPDIILYGPISAAFCIMYQYLRKVPAVRCELQPVIPTVEYAPYALPSMPSWTGLNYSIWRMMCKGYHQTMETRKEIAEEVMGMDFGHSLDQAYFVTKAMWEQPQTAPLIVGISPELSKRPEDWPADGADLCLTGWWVVDRASQEQRLKSGDKMYGGEENELLREFLERSNDRPVYMGWGSMSVVSKTHMTCLAVGALKQAGKRGIVLGGWAKLAKEALSGVEDEAELLEYCKDNVLFMKTAPHAWLFPKCACVVHHGGSGTTAASVMAGVPTIITPVWLDQWDYAKAVTDAGIGFGLPSLTTVTVEELADAVTRCCEDETIQVAAKAMGETTSKSDGVGTAVGVLRRFYEERVATGKWRRDFEEELERNKPKPRGRFGCC